MATWGCWTKRIAAVFACLIAMVSTGEAAEIWTDLGLGGGSVQAVAVDPSDPQRLFAGIWFGDGLYRSLDGAATWQALTMEENAEGEDTFKNQVLLALSISQANPDIVWAAHNYWIAKSADGGDTWTHILNSTVQRDCVNCGGSQDNFRFVYSLASDPSNADIVYAGTAGAWSTYTKGAVYKSVDGGNSWEKLNQGANLDHVVISLAVDPSHPQIVWAATTDFSSTGTVYRSTDAGESWTPIDEQPFSIGTLNMITPHPSDPNEIFVGGYAGVARGTFDGNNWHFSYPIVDCRRAYGLVFAPTDPQLIYVGWKGDDQIPRVSRSQDGGLTWGTNVIDRALINEPRTLAVDPINPNIVYLGANGGGVVKSLDGGQSWIPVNFGLSGVVVYDVAVDDNDTSHLIAATSGGVFERINKTWQRRLPDWAYSVEFLPGASDAYFAGLWGELARTDDGGALWSIQIGVAEGRIDDIAIDPTDTRTVFIADMSHVRRSIDSGVTFTPVLEGVNRSGESYNMRTLAIDPTDTGHIYAGGGVYLSPYVEGDLWESKDGGDTWQRTGLTDMIINKVLLDPRNPDIIYAGCGYSGDSPLSPIFKSIDAGATWSAAQKGLPNSAVAFAGIWADSETNVFAAGTSASIFHYNGESLTLVNQEIGQGYMLQGVFGFDTNSVYAVGAGGIVLQKNGDAWIPMQSDTSVTLYGIWGSAPDDLFAVGENGTIIHFDGSTWSTMESGTAATLHDIFGLSPNRVYAVGDAGTVLHYDGNTWSRIASSISIDLECLWAASVEDVFVGGEDGTLLRYNGSDWSLMDSGTSFNINDLWGINADDVWATADDKGLVLHFDGSAWTSAIIPDAKDAWSIWGLPGGSVFVGDVAGGLFRYDGSEWEAIRTSGSRFRAVTDLAFHRNNADIIYASTNQAGVFISPNQADQWLNLGTPSGTVNAISSGSLFAGTDSGLYQLTGTGVLAGDVYNRDSAEMLDGARVATDLGVENRSIDGLYMMVLPAGRYDVYATAENYNMSTAESVSVVGADVTWVDFEMTAALVGPPIKTAAEGATTVGSTGSGSYCFIHTAADASDAVGWVGWRGICLAAGILVLVHLARRRRSTAIACLAALAFIAFSATTYGFTIFEQVGLASAPQPVGSGARALGMGGAFTAVADDATAASWNPAGLIQVERPEISLVGAHVTRKETFSSDTNPEIDNSSTVSDNNINYASASFPFHWHRNMVVSLNYQRLFDFQREFDYQRTTTAPGVDLNQQIAYQQDGYISAVGLAGAIELTPRLSLGATINIWTDELGYDNGWTENYHEAATGSQAGVPVAIETTIQDRYEAFRGINFNLGLLWDTGAWGTLGAVVKTPFTATIQHRFRFNQTTTYGQPLDEGHTTGPITVEEEVELDMPISYGLGWSRRFGDLFTLGIDIYRTEWGDYSLTNGQGEAFSPIDGRPKSESDVDATTSVRLGAEYLIVNPQHQLVIPLRAGLFYDPEPNEGSANDVYGLALGSGITSQRWSLDIAYQLRWARDADAGSLIAGSDVDITQQKLLASIIYYF